MDEQPNTPDRRGVLIAIVLIAVGAVFLIGEVFNVRFGSGFWPFIIIVPGVLLLLSAFNSRPVPAGTAIGGAVVTTLGLVFWYQNVSGNWESWAYIWSLLPLSAGVAQIIAGTRNEDESLIASGRQTARVSGIMFIIGIVFFELIIFDRGGFGGYFLPIALIAVGGFLLWRHYNQGGELPWQGMFKGPDSTSGPTSSPGPSSPPPTAATPPRQAAVASPPRATAPFPEDELPEQPAAQPEDAAFPVDEQSPDSPPASSAPSNGASGGGSSAAPPASDTPATTPATAQTPAPRRRTTTKRKPTTTRKRPPREG